jgi:hypothetical protein
LLCKKQKLGIPKIVQKNSSKNSDIKPCPRNRCQVHKIPKELFKNSIKRFIKEYSTKSSKKLKSKICNQNNRHKNIKNNCLHEGPQVPIINQIPQPELRPTNRQLFWILKAPPAQQVGSKLKIKTYISSNMS